jgi:hypothetical protein
MKNIPNKRVGALVVTCTVIAGAAIGLPSNAFAADKVYNIALSNSYIGNQLARADGQSDQSLRGKIL